MINYDFSSLPLGWKVCKLKQVATFLDEKRIPIKEAIRSDMRGEYPYYGASGIIDHVNDYLFDGEYVLLGEDGANILSRTQPLAFRVSGKIWVNNHAHVIQPTSNMDIGFLCEYLESISYVKYNTGTAQPKLPRSTCNEIDVVVPPLTEQRKIAEILSTWDEAIATVERLIAALEQRKQGLMQRLLTGEVRFGEFAGSEWEKSQLSELLVEKKRRIRDFPDSEYTLASVRRRSQGIFLREVKSGEELNGTEMYQIRDGDFLISKRQVVHGATALATQEADGYLVSNSYHTLRARNGFEIRFMNWLSKTPRLYHISYVASHGVHIEKLFFVLSAYLRHEISIPVSVAEQTKIVDVLDEAEREIRHFQSYLASLKQQKKGLMQRLLTGEVRVAV